MVRSIEVTPSNQDTQVTTNLSLYIFLQNCNISNRTGDIHRSILAVKSLEKPKIKYNFATSMLQKILIFPNNRAIKGGGGGVEGMRYTYSLNYKTSLKQEFWASTEFFLVKIKFLFSTPDYKIFLNVSKHRNLHGSSCMARSFKTFKSFKQFKQSQETKDMQKQRFS